MEELALLSRLSGFIMELAILEHLEDALDMFLLLLKTVRSSFFYSLIYHFRCRIYFIRWNWIWVPAGAIRSWCEE